MSCESATAPEPIATIEVSPFGAELLVGPAGGATVQMEAVARRANGTAIDGVTFEWSSETPTVLGVSATGLVTALQPGVGVIAASARGAIGESILQVFAVPAASFTISSDSVALEISPLGAGSHQLDFVLSDSTGTAITDRQIFWGTNAPGVATVTGTGLIRAIGGGAARIVGGREGRTDTVWVTVTESDTLPSDADIAISDAQWTQGVQLDDGSLPMIRGGRAAVVNVILTANYSIATPSSVILRIREPGGAIAWTETKSVVVPTGTVNTMAQPHLQFLVPNDLLVAGRTWELLRDPDAALPDASTATDLFPRAGTTPIAVVEVPPLRIRLVPVILLSHGGAMPDLSEGQIEDYIRTVRQVHPHGDIEVTLGPPHATAQSFGTPPNGGGSSFWSPLLSELDVARVADAANASAHWIGIVAPPGGFTFTSFGGIGYIPASGTSFAAGTRTSALVRLGWFNRESQTRELVAHELGHNFGRRHAPCGGAGAPDPSFPRPDGTVGTGGHDVFAWSEGSLTGAPAIGASVGDIMGYCSPVWSSRYTYQGVYNFRGLAPVALRASPAVTRVMMVRGQVARDGVTIDPAVSLDGAPSEDDPEGEYVVELLTADDRVIARQRISLLTLDHVPEMRPFAVHVPISAAAESAVAAIRVTGPAGTARRIPSRAASIRSGPAGVSSEPSPTGRVLRCEDAATRAIVVQEVGSGRVRAMARAATIPVPASLPSALRVSCSDGVRTSAFSIR